MFDAMDHRSFGPLEPARGASRRKSWLSEGVMTNILIAAAAFFLAAIIRGVIYAVTHPFGGLGVG